jgi:hypothetical protein
LLVVILKHQLRQVFQVGQLRFSNVFTLVFGKSINKKSLSRGSLKEDGAKSARPSFILPGYPLLNHSATKIGIDQAPFGAANCLAQGRIRNTLLLRKPLERPVQKDSHRVPSASRVIKISYLVL